MPSKRELVHNAVLTAMNSGSWQRTADRALAGIMALFDALTDSTGGGEKAVDESDWIVEARALLLSAMEEASFREVPYLAARIDAHLKMKTTRGNSEWNAAIEAAAKEVWSSPLNLSAREDICENIRALKRPEAEKSAKNQADGEKSDRGKKEGERAASASSASASVEPSPSALEEREYEEAKNATDADLDLLCLENDHPDGESDSALPLSLAAERSAARTLIEKWQMKYKIAIAQASSARDEAIQQVIDHFKGSRSPAIHRDYLIQKLEGMKAK